jgi:hypothetical protein
MFLQGSCLVRLGNSLRKTGSPPFMVRAIYIDEHYCALEYTLYQPAPGEQDEVNQVIVPLIAK